MVYNVLMYMYSLIPRLLPIFQCCTLKNGKAWFANSRVQHWVRVKLMNIGGVQTAYRKFKQLVLFLDGVKEQ